MKRLWLAVFTGSVLTLSGLTGCGAPPSSSVSESGAAPSSTDSLAQAPQANVQEAADNGSQKSSQETASQESVPRPQLIKRANLSLRVESVEESIRQVREIVNAQQGDVLSLSDRGIRSAGAAASTEDRSEKALNDFVRANRQATLFEIRVPQDRFDTAVNALLEIGEVQNRSVETEDVSSQLVDLQARITNARKSEAALQKIMARSGEIADVLEVSRELSNVRQEIEQMGAAQKNLQTQVSYSTISMSLSSAITQTPNQPAFTRQLANTWKASTSSVGNFTTDLLQLGLWLLVYSPYIAILLCGAVVAGKVLRSSPSD